MKDAARARCDGRYHAQRRAALCPTSTVTQLSASPLVITQRQELPSRHLPVRNSGT